MLNVVLLAVAAPKPFHYWLQLFRQKIVEIMEKSLTLHFASFYTKMAANACNNYSVLIE
jgi:hypothetical protein